MVAWVPVEGRVRALRLLIEGFTAVAVGRAVGVSQPAVTKWARLQGMDLIKGLPGGLRSVGRDAPAGQGQGHGRRLSLADRSRIEVGRERGMSYRAIARMLGVAASTVTREVRRHVVRTRYAVQYDAEVAHQVAADARRRPKSRKLDGHAELRQHTVRLLNDHYSPEQVSGRLVVEFPDRDDMRVSDETIYQALYVQGKGALRHELTVAKALRSGRTRRVPQSRLPARSKRPWLEGARISDRPAEVEDRAVPGHWEGDLVVGPENSGIITLVERQTRFELIGRLPGVRDSPTVIDKLTTMVTGLPADLLRSLTWDQGAEMAQHATFTVATGCPVFFADPHSPWQRGTNENHNGLIREFFPKGTNFNEVTDADLAHVQDLLNRRARKTLQYYTPAERLNQLLAGVALTA